ncbi:lipase family protein [Jannaschia marina]|uniref:alpha/beta hydrolase n=1 Tax=Jannaschia marina TaxID=2741674 RepID=UPI001ABBD33C|nr:alpha/beta hydrolase [Jannaschia marina]
MLRLALSLLLALLPGLPARAGDSPPEGPACVVLLHGLARSDASLLVLEETLALQGYRVVNSDYDSAADTIEGLAVSSLPPVIAQCDDAPEVHFVTHSMGGILLRQWMRENELPRLGRTVMLAPPNHGSEIVDTMADLAAFEWINGPAGAQLGTDGLPGQLGPVWPGVGIIAGTRSLNPVWSTVLPGADDGKVSVASTRVEGMDDHIEVGATHTFMMNQPLVLVQVLRFLETGAFDPELTLAEAVEVLASG